MPDILKIPASELFALLTAIGFAAGLNLYATVAALGLLARFGHLPLPPGLALLQSWPIIGASTALFQLLKCTASVANSTSFFSPALTMRSSSRLMPIGRSPRDIESLNAVNIYASV